MLLILLLSLLLAISSIESSTAGLDQVQDDELMNLIKTEKYVIVLFSRRYCEECDKYENELTSLREELVEELNAWVVKVADSHMTRLYTPKKEPAIVFFRHGIPLLYDGPLNDELIVHTLTNNKEPITKELTDETFEHLTQVSSGATTGDWFVMFYTNDCVDCQRLQARWEAVGARLKSRLSIARVNKGSTGAATARRFDVQFVPAFLYFRQGKLYRYHVQKYDVPSFVSFAQEWYKNVKPEKVAVPKSPFDDLIASIVQYLRENAWLWQVGFGTFLVGLLASLFQRFTKPKVPKIAKKDEEKKDKKKEKSKEK